MKVVVDESVSYGIASYLRNENWNSEKENRSFKE